MTQNDTAYPHVMAGGDRLQESKVTVNILNDIPT
jgi:hypothetical protein